MTLRAAPVALGVCLIVPAIAGAAIFGLIDTGEVYRSTNGGATWSIHATLPIRDAIGLAAGASSSELFLVSRSGTLYRSADASSSWSAVGALIASDVASFTINFDASILVLTESGTLYRSTDGGSGFAAIAALTGSGFASLARGPLGRLYALARSGEVYESQNQGMTWTAVGSVAVSNAVSIRQRSQELHILTETGETYRSLDYGRSWVAIGTITASDMRTLVEVGGRLLAGAETGEVYSSASGSGWTPIGAINQLRVRALAVDTPLATGVEEGSPPRFAVRGPHPNPAPRTGSVFTLDIAVRDQVRLELYDARGRLLARRPPETLNSPGRHEISWKSDAPSGTYFVRAVSASGATGTMKWTLVD